MRKYLFLLIGIVFLSGFVAQVEATPFGYGIATDRNLYSIDLGSGAASLIGATGTDAGIFIEGLAISPNGDLYGTDLLGRLYTINSTNGSASLIGDTGRGNIEGLDFNGNMLLGATFGTDTPTIFSIDTTNANTSDIITATSSGVGVNRAMTTLNSNTMLLSMVGNDSYLYSLNLTTGSFSSIGLLSPFISQSPLGLDFASDGNLYGLWENGEIYQINPSNSATTLIGDAGNYFWLSMSSAQPVPEPATMFLLGTGLVGVAGAARRKKKNQV